MTDRPLIRSPHQVKALLAGATQVRVPIPQAVNEVGEHAAAVHRDGSGLGWVAWWGRGPFTAEETARRYPGNQGFRCPPGAVGDRLWIRESYYPAFKATATNNGCVYRADYLPPTTLDASLYDDKRWRSPALMPRAAARLILEVVEVRAQKLGEVGHDDAVAEGMSASYWTAGDGPRPPAGTGHSYAVERLIRQWNEQYARRGLAWSPGLWTFVATVRRVEGA